MGSEMCIIDRVQVEVSAPWIRASSRRTSASEVASVAPAEGSPRTCLLYTSDAADERSSVDLGGRRIIKKKT